IAGFLDHPVEHACIQKITGKGNALIVHNIELSGPERGSHFVFHHFGLGTITHYYFTLLDLSAASDFDAHRGIELERLPAGGRFRIAEHYTDFHPDLIDEDDHHIGTRDDSRQLAQRLRHEPRLPPHMRIAHLALDFRLRHERGYRIHYDHIHHIGTHQRLHNIERLLAIIRLGNEEIAYIHADALGVFRIQRVFRIHKGRHAARFLCIGDNMQRECRLAG